MALTAAQLTDLQRDIGIGSDEAIFTDDELERLFARADSGYAMTVAYALRQLLVNAARLNDYVRYTGSGGAATRESKSQVFAHLRQMYDLWLAEAGGGLAPLVSGTVKQDFIEPDGTSSEYA